MKKKRSWIMWARVGSDGVLDVSKTREESRNLSRSAGGSVKKVRVEEI